MNKPLDKHYHDKKLRLVLRDLSDMPADEYARALIRLANVADDSVICEPEFAKLRAELERRESHWFSLVMNCAAELEIASYCMTDTAAKRVAQSGADHYRKQANAAPSAPKCPTCRDVGVIGHSQICPECADTWKPAPKADDPVKQMLLEALNGMLLHIREPESESEFQWPEHFKKQKAAFAAARAAIAAARNEGGKV